MAQHKNTPLNDAEKHVILDKGTEAPFTGAYDNFYKKGTYTCRQCDNHLYNASDKFASNCGWPSFDDEVAGAVIRVPDADGRRTEIVCANCKGHLGHVFLNEQLTDKNTRHCVNSISLKFIPEKVPQTATAFFAGGCFWGVEYFMQQQKGVLSVVSGYMGGATENPTYQEVSSGTSGHVEVVEIVYNPTEVSYETLVKLFFEIHDPTQIDGQGPDIGTQYLSVVFYSTTTQENTACKLIEILQEKGFDIATKVIPTTPFYKAEEYHQEYYTRKGTLPYCHGYTKRF